MKHIPAKGTAIRALIVYLLAQSLANSIAMIAIVVIAFAVIGRWPPQNLLLCSSIGGALSPFAWRMYRAVRSDPVVPTEIDGSEPPQRIR
jgi:hypothetical protein